MVAQRAEQRRRERDREMNWNFSSTPTLVGIRRVVVWRMWAPAAVSAGGDERPAGIVAAGRAPSLQ
jgi:hypothetical protein